MKTKNKEYLQYLQNKIYGLKDNPKRLYAEILNFILGRLISMCEDGIELEPYWNNWAEVNKGLNLAITHCNTETSVGKQLLAFLLKTQQKLQGQKPSVELLTTVIDNIKIIKSGFVQ